jgi:hypothetical protein
MQMGIYSLQVRRWGQIGLVALLGLTLALVTVSAGQARAGHAVVAKKKKCKKKHKRSAAAAKKKKCKKKVHHVVLPAPGPLVRATLSWSADDQVDLHAFDASGNHAGWDYNVNPPDGTLVNNIPNARHNGDIGPSGGTESFTDDIFVAGGPSNREFSYVACLYAAPGPDPYTAAFSLVSKDGTSASRTLDGPAIWVLMVPGGPPISDAQAQTACGVT